MQDNSVINLSIQQVSSFVLLDSDPDEVNSIIMNFKTKSSSGYDNIPSSFLILSKNTLIPIICHLLNLCFSQGIFPVTLKQSVITPIYKNGDQRDILN